MLMKIGKIVLASVVFALFVSSIVGCTGQDIEGGGAITGTVHDSDGAPASGVAVSLVSLDDSSTSSIFSTSSQSTNTNSNGGFTFTGLGNGNYNVEATQSNNYKVVNQSITISGGNVVNLGTLTLQQTGAISGYAYLVDQSSHLGIDVFIPGTSFTAKTAADGSYTILYVPPGVFEVDATYLNYESTSETGVTVQSASTTTVPSLMLTPQAGGTYGGVTFELIDKYQGTKLQSVAVTIGYVTKTTDVNGLVTFDTVWAASQSFTASKSAYSTYSGSVLITANTTVSETVYMTTSTFSTFTIGSSGSGDGQFSYPIGVAVDSSGNIYVCDNGNNRIQKFDSSGTFLTKWGSNGSGDGQFNGLRGIVVDNSDNIYVVDRGNNRIQKFNSSGTFLTKWGSNGSGDGQFWHPAGLAIDSSGNIYVCDSANSRIQKFNSSGTFLTKWGSSGSGDGQFDEPQGIGIDTSGNIYVLENATNLRIQKFDSSGSYLTKWGSPGTGDSQFGTGYVWWGLAVKNGTVYSTDAANNRAQVFDSSGNFLTKFGVGELNNPVYIAVDNSGNIYVAEYTSHRIKVYKP